MEISLLGVFDDGTAVSANSPTGQSSAVMRHICRGTLARTCQTANYLVAKTLAGDRYRRKERGRRENKKILESGDKVCRESSAVSSPKSHTQSSSQSVVLDWLMLKLRLSFLTLGISFTLPYPLIMDECHPVQLEENLFHWLMSIQ